MAEKSLRSSIKQQKKRTRNRSLEIRDRMSVARITGKSRCITNRLLEELPVVSRASVIMVYLSFGSEFRTGPLIEESLKAGKKVVVPAIDPQLREIRVYRITNLEDDLKLGHYGIREPVRQEHPADLSQLDLILVPGLAFDDLGNRIGYGAGYYDRFLAAVSGAVKLSACFNCQLWDRVPAEEHDVKVDIIVTENRIIECTPL